MSWIRRTLSPFVLAAALLAPASVQACPLCAEAVAAGGANDEDVSNFPAAMNQSIYLMIGVPYSLLFGVGFMIYRGAKKNDEFRDGLQ